MGGKMSISRTLSVLAVAGALSIAACAGAQAASQVKVTVNNTVITSGDIAKRVAFIRLQRQKGGADEAKKQLVDEVLKRAEPGISTEQARLKAIAALTDVSINEPERVLDSYAFQLSGGINFTLGH